MKNIKKEALSAAAKKEIGFAFLLACDKGEVAWIKACVEAFPYVLTDDGYKRYEFAPLVYAIQKNDPSIRDAVINDKINVGGCIRQLINLHYYHLLFFLSGFTEQQLTSHKDIKEFLQKEHKAIWANMMLDGPGYPALFLVVEELDVAMTRKLEFSIAQSKALVTYLVNQGANVNQLDESGHTMLHNPARHRNIEIIKFLLSLGADKTFVTPQRDTPLDLANRIPLHIRNLGPGMPWYYTPEHQAVISLLQPQPLQQAPTSPSAFFQGGNASSTGGASISGSVQQQVSRVQSYTEDHRGPTKRS